MNRMIGGTLGVAVLGTFIGQTTSRTDFVDSLGQGLLMGGIVAALGAVVAWTLISPELAGGAVTSHPAGRRGQPAAGRA